MIKITMETNGQDLELTIKQMVMKAEQLVLVLAEKAQSIAVDIVPKRTAKLAGGIGIRNLPDGGMEVFTDVSYALAVEKNVHFFYNAVMDVQDRLPQYLETIQIG